MLNGALLLFETVICNYRENYSFFLLCQDWNFWKNI